MNAHSRARHTSPLRLILAGAGLVGVLSALGITYVIGHRASASSTPASSTPAAAKRHPVVTVPSTTVPQRTTAVRSTQTLPPAQPTVVSITPAAGATNVAPDAVIAVKFSAPVTAHTVAPTVSPAVTGTWTSAGSTMTFTPTAGWVPYSTVRVTVPAPEAAGAVATSDSFGIGAGSVLRVQQLLALLGYLPVTFIPGDSNSVVARKAQPAAMDADSTVPVPGTFRWTYPTTPAQLEAQWKPDTATAITKGAVMAFEADHHLTADGVAGPAVWSTLLQAAASHTMASHPYSYLMVSETEPEQLQLWSQGAIVLTTLANTGAPGAATELGTYPVFEHLLSTTMIGTEPDGVKYDDPGVKYVAYFNGGDAVHEYLRASYGWPQSNGCVELPASSAATVWSYDPIGTLVTVSA